MKRAFKVYIQCLDTNNSPRCFQQQVKIFHLTLTSIVTINQAKICNKTGGLEGGKQITPAQNKKSLLKADLIARARSTTACTQYLCF